MRLLLLLALWAMLAAACPGVDHDHGLGARSQWGASQPSGGRSLVRPITWGQINIVHTTDIHGWYQGHLAASQPEPNYSGDWGDFASFVAHLRRNAKARGVDLLVVDTGDLQDGTGLADAPPAGQVASHTANEFHLMIRYDLLTPGNHNFYNYTLALDTYRYFAPATDGRFIASNVNITLPSGKEVPMGKRYLNFTTDMGRRVTAFGVLFNFAGAAKGIHVQRVEEMVKEDWFQEAIRNAPDVFILTGHMPVAHDNFPTVIDKIRSLHPSVPILVLGGHTHIRDCVVYDRYAMGLESGRYMETIGWLSANSSDWAAPAGWAQDKHIAFSRSYIDANRRNYAIHSGLTQYALDTPAGKNVTLALEKVASAWNLSHVLGVAPQDYSLEGYAMSDERSLLNLLTQHVLPTIISTSEPSRDVPNIVLANSGSQRFSIHRGNFTRNDQFIVSPFIDYFLHVRDVEWQYAAQLVGRLNTDYGVYSSRLPSSMSGKYEDTYSDYKQGSVDNIYRAWRQEQANLLEERDVASLSPAEELILMDAQADRARQREGPTVGYVTQDECPGEGDDTLHVPLPYTAQPDYVQSLPVGNSSALEPTTKVDVIFLDFIERSILQILNTLQKERVYSSADVQPYGPNVTTQQIYALYAQHFWS